VTHGIWEGAAVKLVAQHGEDRVRVQLAHHQVRLDHGFTFRGAPAAHLYAAIVHDYAPWVPPAPGARPQEGQEGPRNPRRVSQDPPREKAPRPTWDEAQAAGRRALAEARAAMPWLRRRAR